MRLSLLASACLLFAPLPLLASSPPSIQIFFDPPVVSPGEPVTANFTLGDTCYTGADAEIVARSASERLIRIIAHEGCDCAATPLPEGFSIPLGVLPIGAHTVELAIDRCNRPAPRLVNLVNRSQVVVGRLAPIVNFQPLPARPVSPGNTNLHFGTLCPAVEFGAPSFREDRGVIVTVPVTDSIADPCLSQPPGFPHVVPLPPLAVGRYGVELKGPGGQIDNLGSFFVEAPGGDSLLLHAARFQVRASWRDKLGNSGTGVPVPLTGQTGYFWFFDAGNVELLVKVLDGCSINQRWWVFAAGLTDVEVVLTVTDTRNGEIRTYSNTVGQPFAPIQDTTAFIGCGSELVID
jgi:hypothetical protein